MIVTTTSRPRPAQIQRAHAVAARCGVPYLPRQGPLPPGLRYVVGRTREELQRDDERLSVHEGMLRARLHAGGRHPLIVALTHDGPVRTVIDGTLGLAQDALHLAAALDCEVIGIEGSAPVGCLLQEGLSRLGTTIPAARRIQLRLGDAATILEQLPPQSADAVYLSPMYPSPTRAAPGFALLREIALDAPLDARLLQAACRVSRGPVVLKVAPGDAPGVGTERGRARGRAVDYVVLGP